jgi:hypothetical protein
MSVFKRLIDPARVVDMCLVVEFIGAEGFVVMTGDHVDEIFPLLPTETRVSLKARADKFCNQLNNSRYAVALTAEAESLGLLPRRPTSDVKLRLVHSAAEATRHSSHKASLSLVQGGRAQGG